MMKRQNDPTFEMLDRYMAGQASAKERQAVEEHLQADPADALIVQEILAFEPVAGKMTEPSVAERKVLFEARIGTAGVTAVAKSVHRQNPEMGVNRWIGYSAVLIIAVATSLTFGDSLFSRLTNNSTPSYRTVATSTGERATIKLTDGSSVVLGPESRLRYRTDYGAKTRELLLEGQALFTVVNHSGSPLIVRTGNTTTRVLGTTFSVRRYAADSSVRVAVAQGKVAFESVVLGTGDLAVRHSGAAIDVTRDVNVAAMLAWADGKLVFDNTPIRDVIPELKRWYGIQVTVTDTQLLNARLVLTLSSETSSDALRLIGHALGVPVTLSGRQAVLGSQQ